MISLRKKCRYFIEELETLLNFFFSRGPSGPFSIESCTKLGEGAKPTKKFKRCISIFATTKNLATTFPLPLVIFRRRSNFSFYKIADSTFLKFLINLKNKCIFQNQASAFQYFSTLIDKSYVPV